MSRSLVALGRLGLSLTTVMTAAFYFLGVAYYDGLFRRLAVPVPQIDITWSDAIRPRLYSLALLYHVLLGYVDSRHRAIRSSRDKAGLLLVSSVGELWWLKTLNTASLIFTAWMLFRENFFLVVTVIIGGVTGIALRHISTWTVPGPKIIAFALAFIGSAFHSTLIGRRDAEALLKSTPVEVRVESQSSATVGFVVYRSDSGIFVEGVIDKQLSLLYLPWQRVLSIRSNVP